jgi:fumarate reductase iron-sulfur subunit
MAERLLTFSIFRYNPATPEIPPRMQEYQLAETMGMSLFIALNLLREEQDPSLMFDFVCRAGRGWPARP